MRLDLSMRHRLPLTRSDLSLCNTIVPVALLQCQLTRFAVYSLSLQAIPSNTIFHLILPSLQADPSVDVSCVAPKFELTVSVDLVPLYVF